MAVPYPGRGHVNPMMNLCKLFTVFKETGYSPNFFFVTGEWLGLIDSNTKNSTIQFASIPNVIPSELVRGADSTRL
jgi:hypothetical protein|uniref:Uncharacterized protein n=1 Tax=Populus trichocarpa TaxID=3694 RepID=B9GH65_POPTR